MRKKCKRCRSTGKVRLGKNRINCPVCKRSKNPKRKKGGFPPAGFPFRVDVTFADGTTLHRSMSGGSTKQESRFYFNEAVNDMIHQQHAAGKSTKIKSWMWDTEFSKDAHANPRSKVLKSHLTLDPTDYFGGEPPYGASAKEVRRFGGRRSRIDAGAGAKATRRILRPGSIRRGMRSDYVPPGKQMGPGSRWRARRGSNPGLIEGIAAVAATTAGLAHLGDSMRRKNPMRRSSPPRWEQEDCPTCGGPGIELGKLGNRTHLRCQDCGQQWSTVDDMHGGSYYVKHPPVREGNPEIRPRIHSGRFGDIRPRLSHQEPSPYAHIAGRGGHSKFKGKLRGKLKSPYSKYQGLSYNPMDFGQLILLQMIAEDEETFVHGGEGADVDRDLAALRKQGYLTSDNRLSKKGRIWAVRAERRGAIPRKSFRGGFSRNPRGSVSGSYPIRTKRKGYSTAAKSFISKYIMRHSSGRKLSASTRGKLLAEATSKARSKGLIAKSKSKTKSKSKSRSFRTTSRSASYGSRSGSRTLHRRSSSRRSGISSRFSRSSSRSHRSVKTGTGLRRIYDHVEKIFARGSVNSGSHGITKSTPFKHDVTSRPPAYGVMKSGTYHLPRGAVVIKGKKPLFGVWDKSGKKTFGSKGGSH